MEYITLQEAVWKKLNCTSTRKNTRAQAKLSALALCDIMKDKWNTQAASDTFIKRQETNLYFTKNTEEEVIAIPIAKASLFVDKYILRAQNKYIKDMNEQFDDFYARNPNIKRLSIEEIKNIQLEKEESEHESEAQSDEY